MINIRKRNNLYEYRFEVGKVNGKRKQKWVSTGLSEKGNNKRLANQKMQEILADFKETINCTTSYKVIVNKICDYFEDKQLLLKDLKPVHIQEFYTTLYEKN